MIPGDYIRLKALTIQGRLLIITVGEYRLEIATPNLSREATSHSPKTRRLNGRLLIARRGDE